MSSEEDLKYFNDIIAERFRRIEDRLASAETVAELFEHLLDGIEKEFSVPFVWLSLTDHDSASPLLDEVRKSDFLKNRFSVVSSDLLAQIIGEDKKPVLANKDLLPFYRLLPPNRKYFVKSVAVAPLVLDGRIIGTWNNGDADATRYEPGMKTDLIASLASGLSRKLERLVAGQSGAAEEMGQGEPAGGLYD